MLSIAIQVLIIDHSRKQLCLVFCTLSTCTLIFQTLSHVVKYKLFQNYFNY